MCIRDRYTLRDQPWDFCQLQYNYRDRDDRAEEISGDRGYQLTEECGVPLIDEVAPLLRGMYARQMDGFGQEQPQPSAESPTFHSETVAVYPGDKNNLPYDVVVERLHITGHHTMPY